MGRCSKQKGKQVHCFLIVKQASSHVAKNATCHGILHSAYQLVIMGAEEPKLDVDSYEEQFYASTKEKESVARPSVHSQTTLVQGQRRELTDSYSGVLGLRGKKRSACRQTCCHQAREHHRQCGILNVFHLKIILLSHQRKTPCLHRVNLLQPRRYYISCLRSNRSIDWPRSQCPAPPASTLKLRRLENVVLYFCMYCTVVPYSTVVTVHTSRNW